MNWIAALLVVLAGTLAAVLVLRRNLERARGETAAKQREVEKLRTELEASICRLERTTAVVAGARLGVLVMDGKGAVIQANPAAAEFVGARHGAALAESRVRALVETALRTQERHHEEIEIRSPLPRTLHVTAERIGTTQWAVAYIDDVTERRRVDAARRDFVANVSHELKTPLGALTLLAETLEGTTDAESRRKLIGRIGEQALRMSSLVDDILDLSLVEAAGMEPAIVDLNKVLSAAVADVRDLAQASEVLLEIGDPVAEVHVLGDERQLVSAATNMLSNAVVYTSVASPPRRVVARAQLREDAAIIEIADTGIGIGAKHRARIFERFYRVDPARSRETGGTGLGLAIVRHVALNHGGTMEVDSEPGVGSTFRMVIPLDTAATS